jgi:F-type H+-transporting ATPase subunit delta
MKITKQARREAKAMFRSCLVNGVLDEDCARRAVQSVIESKPRGYLAILTHFQRLVKLDLDRRTAKVESAAALNPEVQTRVRNQLARVYGPGLNLVFAQRPELIGGLRIQVGSDVYDGSIRARLSDLEQSF